MKKKKFWKECREEGKNSFLNKELVVFIKNETEYPLQEKKTI